MCGCFAIIDDEVGVFGRYKSTTYLLAFQTTPLNQSSRIVTNWIFKYTAAIKAARAITGREKILRCSASYHGWHDWYNCHTERNIGVPEFNKDLCIMFDFNDIEGFKKIINEQGDKIACVIMEGITTTYPNQGFLESYISLE